MTVCELVLDIYVLMKDGNLDQTLREVAIPEDVVCRFHDSAPCTDAPVHSNCIIISDDTHELKALCNITEKNVSVILLGTEGDVLACAGEFPPCLRDIWPTEASANEYKWRFSRLLCNCLAEHEAWLKDALLKYTINSMPEMVWYKNLEGNHQIVNDQFCKIVHKDKDDVQGKGHCYIWDVPPEDYERGEFVCKESDNAVMDKKETCIFEEAVKTKDGMRQFRTYKSPLFDKYGGVMGTVGIGHDVTDFSNTDIELGILIDNMPFQMVICDINWKVVRINDQFKLTFNENGEEFIDADFRQWKNSTFAVIKNLENTDDGHGNYQELTFDGDGNLRIFKLAEKEIVDSFGYVSGYYCMFSDITVDKLYEKEMTRDANTDPLTGLYNRRYLYDYLHDHESEPMSIYYMDLDFFRKINDTYGHACGDYILEATADTIGEIFPEGMAARMGGDEFVIVTLGKHSKDDIDKSTKAMMEAMGNVQYGDCQKVTISIGVASSSGGGTDMQNLINESDSEMYKIKSHKHVL
ncbi:MAG: GGDEF domain-containing protein [Clostridiales bacterium]|nr:GGDEF domain-containing protein [Clostridiales bacterium]